jgi:hypothetical protein
LKEKLDTITLSQLNEIGDVVEETLLIEDETISELDLGWV